MKTSEQFLERLHRAKAMTSTERFFEGPRLFDEYCAKVRRQIRDQFPDANDESVLLLLRRHVAIYADFDNGLELKPNEIPISETETLLADDCFLRDAQL